MSVSARVASSTKVLKNLVSTVQQLYPAALADKTWDNTGLLLDSPPTETTTVGQTARVLLTIDLTTAVVDEALQKQALLVVAYHPIIFRPLKSLSLANTQQRSLIRLAQAGISVYSPHTAVDAQVGGMNDWLARVATGVDESAALESAVIEPNESVPETGFGRLVRVSDEALTLLKIIENVKSGLGLKHVQVAIADRHKNIDTATIKSIAICAGSGGSVLGKTDADLWFTGELSHHEVLAIKERGISAIICGHTNTERGYLSSVFAPSLLSKIADNKEELGSAHYEGYDIDVVVSEQDRDPLTVF
ncbi:GTP cyclohydrolase 1 type 2/Nif3 [Myxozyma melibiosi]|uniref:GTP cyclohydrolase 1 type 2/Nif3 n=1 Tax=Myxozyma melibiosi TaxID=54550 RepID=A0ABR1F6I9_9ASCO